MLAMTRKKKLGLGILLLAGLLIVLSLPGVAVSTPPPLGVVCETGPTFNLQATDGYVSMPDGNMIYMWGYALDPGTFQMPGPILCVDQDDPVEITLTNNLTETVSIIFPGQSGVTASGGSSGLLTNEAAPPGGASTVTYSFVASEPGTFLYESGTNQHKQVQMGLVGMLVVRPDRGANYAYDHESTEFLNEYMILLQEIDPILHQAVESGQPYDVTTRHDRYWTINGRATTDNLLPNGIPWMPSQPYGAVVYVQADAEVPALIRYVNAGTVNHPFHPHGDFLDVIGRDGRYLDDARFTNFTTTIGAGQTNDLLFTWDNVEGFISEDINSIPPNEFFPFPGLQNQVFKDDVTFYSGDPYLGQQGELPTGTTSFNACGEYYFPWHSHALQEIQNFDEGFGGMLTVVRVDPPGGCP